MIKTEEATSKWLYPWNIEVFNDMNHDNRFFALVIKALLTFLDSNITLYSKGIRHFILSTGKEYLYQESNGYNFSWSETTGEDMIYMQKPRCTVSWDSIEIETNSISSPYARGTYERPALVDNEFIGEHIEIREYSAEIRLLPVKIPVTLRYVLSNFNESLIITEELLTMFTMVRYFSFSYLGQRIDCSVSFPTSFTPANTIKTEYNAESKNRELEIKLDLKTIYPVMFKNTEIDASHVIKEFVATTSFYKGNSGKLSDAQNYLKTDDEYQSKTSETPTLKDIKEACVASNPFIKGSAGGPPDSIDNPFRPNEARFKESPVTVTPAGSGTGGSGGNNTGDSGNGSNGNTGSSGGNSGGNSGSGNTGGSGNNSGNNSGSGSGGNNTGDSGGSGSGSGGNNTGDSGGSGGGSNGNTGGSGSDTGNSSGNSGSSDGNTGGSGNNSGSSSGGNSGSGSNGNTGSSGNNSGSSSGDNSGSDSNGNTGSSGSNTGGSGGNNTGSSEGSGGNSGGNSDNPGGTAPVTAKTDNPSGLVLKFSKSQRKVIETIMNDKDELYQVIQRALRNSDGAEIIVPDLTDSEE